MPISVRPDTVARSKRGHSKSKLYFLCSSLSTYCLALVDVTFLNYLLDLVERTRTDAAEFLNYGIIKLLLVFNEQFMLSRALYTQAGPQLAYSGNPLLSVLMDRPGASCTFGESLIFMLNRAGTFSDQDLRGDAPDQQ